MNEDFYFNIGDEVGDYEIVRALGKSLSGEVYLVNHHLLNQLSVMRIMFSEKLFADSFQHDRFFEDIQTAYAIRHPNLAQITYFSQYQELNMTVIVSDYVEGDTLLSIMKTHPERMTIPFALEITEKVASAIEEISKHGLIHRNIKPSNIMVTRDHQIKLTDLGIAGATEDAGFSVQDGGAAPMENQTVKASVYASPEQNQDVANSDTRSDIYSLGMCLYYMTTGKLPFRSTSLAFLIAEIMYQELPAPTVFCKTIPEALSQFIMRLIAKAPENRPQTASQLLQELADLKKKLSAPKTVHIPTPALPKPPASATAPAELKMPEAAPSSGLKLMGGAASATGLKLTGAGAGQSSATLSGTAPAAALKMPKLQLPKTQSVPAETGPASPEAASPAEKTPVSAPPAEKKAAPPAVALSDSGNEVVINEIENRKNVKIPFSWTMLPAMLSLIGSKVMEMIRQSSRDLGGVFILCICFSIAIVFGLSYDLASLIGGEAQYAGISTVRAYMDFKDTDDKNKRFSYQMKLAREGHWKSVQFANQNKKISECIAELQKKNDSDALLTAATMMMLQLDKKYSEAEYLAVMEKAAVLGSLEAAGFLRVWHENGGDLKKAKVYRDLCGELIKRKKAGKEFKK